MLTITTESKKDIIIVQKLIMISFSLDGSICHLQFLYNEFYSFIYVWICNVSIPTILAVREM